jgi:hypothetical protein
VGAEVRLIYLHLIHADDNLFVDGYVGHAVFAEPVARRMVIFRRGT